MTVEKAMTVETTTYTVVAHKEQDLVKGAIRIKSVLRSGAPVLQADLTPDL